MTYRLLLIATSAVCLSAATASRAQEVNWSGFYIGANLGGSWGDVSMNTHVSPGVGPIVIPPVDVTQINQTPGPNSNKSGFTGGVQGGFNWQSDSLLLGIETDWGFMDIDNHRTNVYQSLVQVTPPIVGPPPPVPTYTLEQRAQTNWIWTLRPRLGYVSGPWMIYGTAGLATTSIDLETKYSDTRIPPNSGSVSDSKSKWGWAAGLGGAYAFTPEWSVRGEWLYADFGSVRDNFVSTNGFAVLTSEAKVRANLLRLGVDYKF